MHSVGADLVLEEVEHWKMILNDCIARYYAKSQHWNICGMCGIELASFLTKQGYSEPFLGYHISRLQQIPDNHTMLNHTTLLFAPNLPGINRNINKFALIITQKSPDNHTMSSQFSTLTAFIYELLLARKYCLWFLRLQRQFASVSII